MTATGHKIDIMISLKDSMDSSEPPATLRMTLSTYPFLDLLEEILRKKLLSALGTMDQTFLKLLIIFNFLLEMLMADLEFQFLIN